MSYLEIILDHLNISMWWGVLCVILVGGGKVNKKKENSTYGRVLRSFFEKRLYYEQIHLHM